MKNQFIKKLLFLFFIPLQTIAIGGVFSVSISSPGNTSTHEVLFLPIKVPETKPVYNTACVHATFKNNSGRNGENVTTIIVTPSCSKNSIIVINSEQERQVPNCTTVTDLKKPSTDKRNIQNLEELLKLHTIEDSYVLNFKYLPVLDKSKSVSKEQAIFYAT